MTGLVILTFIPFVAAVFFLIRTRVEQKARRAAEARIAQLEGSLSAAALHSEWNAVLGHELRSPIAAILGYQELIEDGTFGELPPAAGDSLRRIRLAARQLLILVEAVERTGRTGDSIDAPATINARDLASDAVESVRFEAETRNTDIAFDNLDFQLRTRPAEACRALILALGAAVKVSPAARLSISGLDGAVPRISVAGAALQPDRDTAGSDVPLSAAALRLELARAAARSVEGAIRLDDAGTLHLELPRLD